MLSVDKITAQENMFHDFPLCKLPTLKRLVEDAGLEGDLCVSLLEQSALAMSEAAEWDLDTESRHIWNFIVRTHKLLKSVHREALAAAGNGKEVRHA